MRIDAHIHYAPPEMADNLDTFAEQEPYWGLLIKPGGAGHDVQGWASAERMIADMDRAAIDKVVIQGGYRRTPQGCTETNNQTLQLMRRYPERVIGFAVLQPQPPQAALDELARCLDAGMLGVGELNPYGQGMAMDDPHFCAVVEACIRRNIPLCLHVNEEIGHFYLGKTPTPLLHDYWLASTYPELKLILAHWGGGLLFYEIMPEVKRALSNVCYDTAASPLIFPTRKIFSLALQVVDRHKILYGSDYPLLIYPRSQPEPGFERFLQAIDELGLDEPTRAAILGENAARLLGLSNAPAQSGKSMPAASQPPHHPTTTAASQTAAAPLDAFTPIRLAAETWPQTRAVFDAYGIDWREAIVPFWLPVVQAAAASGLGPRQQEQLLRELNEAIKTSRV